jgi:tetratricopeptide (TPR) repeat protein
MRARWIAGWICVSVLWHECAFAGKVTDDYAELSRKHESGIFQEAKQPTTDDGSRLEELFEIRDAAYADFAAAGRLLDMASLDWDDRVTLALCHEAIKDQQNAVRFAVAAAELRPEDERSYFPQVRALLNDGRVEEAEALMERLDAQLPPENEIRYAYAHLYSSHAARGNHAKALKHCHQFMDFHIAALVRKSGEGHVIRVYLKMLQDAYKAAGRSDDYAAAVSKYDAQLAADIDSLEAGADSEMSLTDAVTTAALLHSRFVLAASHDVDLAIVRFHEWHAELARFASRADRGQFLPSEYSTLAAEYVESVFLAEEGDETRKIARRALNALELADPHYRQASLPSVTAVLSLIRTTESDKTTD